MLPLKVKGEIKPCGMYSGVNSMGGVSQRLGKALPLVRRKRRDLHSAQNEAQSNLVQPKLPTTLIPPLRSCALRRRNFRFTKALPHKTRASAAWAILGTDGALMLIRPIQVLDRHLLGVGHNRP